MSLRTAVTGRPGVRGLPPIPRRPWVRLDNASNIFLAARSEIDTKVFRYSADLDEDIDPDLLQEALDRVYVRYPLYSAVLRRGLFWYYLQQSDRRPVIAEDTGPSVTHIYHAHKRGLLFRVLYRRARISVEMFHALTDGTGALWFVRDLLTEYIGLRHPDEFTDPPAPTAASRGITHDLDVDAFTHWFRAGTAKTSFTEEAADPLRTATRFLTGRAPGVGREPGGERPADRGARRRRRRGRRRSREVLRVRGQRTPDGRTRVVELSMPVAPVLALARAEGVSLTLYLTAVFFQSLRATGPPRERARTLAVSVPVNLRRFFPSDSARNFFATTRLQHTYGEEDGPGTLGAVCRDLKAQFDAQLTPQSLEAKLRRLIGFENNLAIRVVPRPVKNWLLGTLNLLHNRGLTVAISNVGRVALPGPADSHLHQLALHVSAARPQFCMVSHGDRLTVSFTSPFVETDHQAAFVRHLRASGVPVRVVATRVTDDELAPGAGEQPAPGAGEQR